VQESRERGNNHPVTEPRRARAIVLGWVLPVVVALVVLQFWVYRATNIPGLAPRPASGLHELTTLADLQTAFANDIGKARLLLLISPT
jgi:hypothetical protein